jgi:[glutamine synthetase] adenylyltransferase / [glutamine synthetase]-adenylyl-L-tyrosine phosphorylase
MTLPQSENLSALVDFEQLSTEEIHTLLTPLGFNDCDAVFHVLRRLFSAPESGAWRAELVPYLLTRASSSANPDQVIVNLDRFLLNVPDRARLTRFLVENQRGVDILAVLFAGSQFLTETLLRSPEYLERLVQHQHLSQPHNVADLYHEARQVLERFDETEDQLDALRRMHHWEMLRIGACDLLDLFDMPTATRQLSHLADALVQVCLEIASDQTGIDPAGFIVVALGKLGGNEVNYSSDIDLLFLTESDASACHGLGQRLINNLSEVTHDGFLYRVDMRLRPWGRVGALVTSTGAYLTYLEKHAALWEKQALLKARIIAGDIDAGNAFFERLYPLIFASIGDNVRSEVHAMKLMTEAYLIQKGRDWGEVKLGEGSIRDIEFVTQVLQLRHKLRGGNTLDTLALLSSGELFNSEDYRTLVDGYIFLRTIEHYLQMMHYQQTNRLPRETEALHYLARRLGFEGVDADELFLERYRQHCKAIRAVYLRHMEEDDMDNPTQSSLPTSHTGMDRHLASLDPSYAELYSPEDIQLHARMAAQLGPDTLVQLDAANLEGNLWRVTIIGYDYPGVLSLICGLMFVYGFSIHDGEVYTYELAEPDPASAREKIVDTFTVESLHEPVDQQTWQRYEEELADLLKMMDAGGRREARGRLAKRVTTTFHTAAESVPTLYPIEIEIDNQISERNTVLHIDAPDTRGFLYELSNSLAYNRINIVRVRIKSIGSRVEDTLYVTDYEGRKVIDPERQRELRAAIVLIKHFTHLLPYSPNPESALLHFRELIGQVFRQPDWPDDLISLQQPKVLNALARLLGISDFLWDDFLRLQYANLFPVVQDVDALAEARSKEELQEELLHKLDLSLTGGGKVVPPGWRRTLNAFKDREMFRIDMRHILGHIEQFGDFSSELTDLSEVTVETAARLCQEELSLEYGQPFGSNGICPFTIFALGKCGGRELGFASDIELMFIYGGNCQIAGEQPISTAEYYEKVVQLFLGAISARRKGVFTIDLQLRPYGDAGHMAVSLEGFKRYFSPQGPAWAYERQALIKLRPIAGNPELGAAVASLRDAYVYSGELYDTKAMRAMRERQLRHMVAGGSFNAKYSLGGLVDIEYLVQGLQITHGVDNPTLRLTNTREAMSALHKQGFLSTEDYRSLHKAHTFLRWLIDALRVVRGNSKDLSIPSIESEEFAFLTRRLRFGSDREQFQEDLQSHTSAVQEMNTRLLPSSE